MPLLSVSTYLLMTKTLGKFIIIKTANEKLPTFFYLRSKEYLFQKNFFYIYDIIDPITTHIDYPNKYKKIHKAMAKHLKPTLLNVQFNSDFILGYMNEIFTTVVQ